MEQPIVYLMRGLPSTGKSTTARRLVGETGAVFETDSFFMTEVGDDPRAYSYDRERLTEARDWNYECFMTAVSEGISPIVVDRGNSLSLETKRYAVYAAERGYRVELVEPDSEWWQEIKVLLKYKRVTGVLLVAWARQLAKLSRVTHRVPVRDILRQMSRWNYALTVDDIMTYEPVAPANGGSERNSGSSGAGERPGADLQDEAMRKDVPVSPSGQEQPPAERTVKTGPILATTLAARPTAAEFVSAMENIEIVIDEPLVAGASGHAGGDGPEDDAEQILFFNEDTGALAEAPAAHPDIGEDVGRQIDRDTFDDGGETWVIDGVEFVPAEKGGDSSEGETADKAGDGDRSRPQEQDDEGGEN